MTKSALITSLTLSHLIFATAFGASPAFATENEIESLLFANSAADIEKLEERLNLDQVLELNCKSELNLNVLPKSCFRVLDRKKEAATKWLKAECLSRAKASKSRIDLRDGLEFLPSPCQDAARNRLADLEYLDVSERPSEIWTLERKVN